MVSKAGRAVRLVDRLNSKLRKKPTEKTAFQKCMSNALTGKMGGNAKDRRATFKAAAKACGRK